MLRGLLIGLGLWLMTSAQALEARTYRVLVLNANQAGVIWDAQFEEGLNHGMGQADLWFYHHRIQYVDEAFTEFRRAQEQQLNELMLYYQFDYVVTLGDYALQLATHSQGFRDYQYPVIAAVRSEFSVSDPIDNQSIIVVQQALPLADNLALYHQLLPNLDTLHLLVSTGPTGEALGRRFTELAEQQGLEVKLWTEADYEELKAHASTMANGEAIVFAVFREHVAEGIALNSHNMESLASLARVPLFSLSELPIGVGALGGKVIRASRIGEQTSVILNKLLQGRDFRRMGQSDAEQAEFVFDSQQLKRWGISRSQLPETARLMNDTIQPRFTVAQMSLSLSGWGVGIVLLLLCLLLWLRVKRKHKRLQEALARWEAGFNCAHQAMALLDADGMVIKHNTAMQRLLGGEERIADGDHFLEHLRWPDRMRSGFSEQFAKACQGEMVLYFGQFAYHQQRRLLDISFTPKLDSGYRTESVLLEVRDLEQVQVQQQALTESEEMYRHLFDTSPAMLFMVNPLGVICMANEAFANHLGYSRQSIELLQLRGLYINEKEKHSLPKYLLKLSQQQQVQTREVAYHHRDGEEYWFRESALSLPDRGLVLFVCEDITVAKAMQHDLNFHANYDALTGIYNRGYLERHLQRLLDHSEQQQHAMLHLDLSQFKVINDSFGHGSGDQALQQVSRVLQHHLPENAIVSRLGSDEFGMILTDVDQKQAVTIAEELLAKLQDTHFVRDERMISFGGCLGLTMFDRESGASVQSIMAQADNACFSAKALGRNRIFIFHDEAQEIQHRQGQVAWVSRIQKALREDRFIPYAQKIVPVSGPSEDYLHYEVLIRMIDEEGRIVPPGLFLPAAENYNLIDQIDRLVITKTLVWLSETPSHVARLNMCSINLSGHSLGNSDFINWLVDYLQQSALPLNKLCFETTETVAIANLQVATDFFNRVRALGCKVALDDFGSGLSSFGYIKSLPIDYLKIDGMFVRDIANDAQDAAIVRSIHQLAETLGKQTVAEFVEDAESLAILQEIGVDYAQGYYFGKPTPMDMLALS